MELDFKKKVTLLNQVRVQYFTSRNKPLSLLILAVIFVLFSIQHPVIGFLIVVIYGLILVFAIKRGQKFGRFVEKETKKINNSNNEGYKDE
jgi:ABC-type multidrug transport system fused ATPase/permease subunit